MKFLIVILILVTVLIAGCTANQLAPGQLSKNIEEVKDFLKDYPNAKIVAVFIGKNDVDLDTLKKDCGNQMKAQDYWKATITDSDTNTTLILWLDYESQKVLCAIRSGGNISQNVTRYVCSNGSIVNSSSLCPTPQNPCYNIVCNDYCSENTLYYNGTCVNGQCQFSSQVCQYGCSNNKCNSKPAITMGTQFALEAAACSASPCVAGNTITMTIRNTGQPTFDATKTTFYVDGVLFTGAACAPAAGCVATTLVTGCTYSCSKARVAADPQPKCGGTTTATISTMKAVIATGLEATEIIECSGASPTTENTTGNQFALEAAACSVNPCAVGSTVSMTIRNTGQSSFDVTKTTFYIDGMPFAGAACSSPALCTANALANGCTYSCTKARVAADPQPSCPTGTTPATTSVMKVVISTGSEQTKIIACSGTSPTSIRLDQRVSFVVDPTCAKLGSDWQISFSIRHEGTTYNITSNGITALFGNTPGDITGWGSNQMAPGTVKSLTFKNNSAVDWNGKTDSFTVSAPANPISSSVTCP